MQGTRYKYNCKRNKGQVKSKQIQSINNTNGLAAMITTINANFDLEVKGLYQSQTKMPFEVYCFYASLPTGHRQGRYFAQAVYRGRIQ